jgi:RNA methyltransferase, TrmH family
VTLPVATADITSPRNRWIKLARSLHRRRQRYSERAILVEGVRPVREALTAGVEIVVVLYAADLDASSEASDLVTRLTNEDIRTFGMDPELLKLAADTETPQGILAICSMPESEPGPPSTASPLYLIVDRVRDPGNLGTLLRSAQGAGVDQVLIAPESADPYSPKVIRAGAGSHFRMPIAIFDWSDPPEWLDSCKVFVADAESSTEYDTVDWTQPAAIVVGNETLGPSEAAFQRADGRVGIPLANSLESLNAGVAGSVILFEAWRQRRGHN